MMKHTILRIIFHLLRLVTPNESLPNAQRVQMLNFECKYDFFNDDNIVYYPRNIQSIRKKVNKIIEKIANFMPDCPEFRTISRLFGFR